MVPWHEFVAAAPELAATGEGLLFQFGVGLAFLATVRKDGGPRLHPVCPVLSHGRLYVLTIPTSPKQQDLRRDGRYALQTFPQPKPDSAEFYITGRADLIEDPSLRRAGIDIREVSVQPRAARLSIAAVRDDQVAIR